MYSTCTSYFIGFLARTHCLKLQTVESRSEKGKLLFTAVVLILHTYIYFCFLYSITSFYRMHSKMYGCDVVYDYTHLNRYRPRLCKKLLGKVRRRRCVIITHFDVLKVWSYDLIGLLWLANWPTYQYVCSHTFGFFWNIITYQSYIAYAFLTLHV